MNEINLARVKADLLRHEGLRLKPYRCSAGKLTIGVGRNLDDIGIIQSEADLMLDQDINRVEKELSQRLDWYQDANITVKEVLINMCFNLGIVRLLGFKKALAAMKGQQWSEAAKEMLDSKWAAQVGKRADELASRIKSIGL